MLHAPKYDNDKGPALLRSKTINNIIEEDESDSQIKDCENQQQYTLDLRNQ